MNRWRVQLLTRYTASTEYRADSSDYIWKTEITLTDLTGVAEPRDLVMDPRWGSTARRSRRNAMQAVKDLTFSIQCREIPTEVTFYEF